MNQKDLLFLKERGHNIVNAEYPIKNGSEDLIAIEVKGEIHLFSLIECWVGQENGWERGEAKFKRAVPIEVKIT